MRADRLERQLPVLAARPDLAFAPGRRGRAARRREPLEPLGADDTFDELLAGKSASGWRALAVREVGGYHETLFLEDHDL